MNIEQIKMKIATAIEHRIAPPTHSRARYHLWIDPGTREIGCGWATVLRLQPHQQIVHTFMRDPNLGFSADEWSEMAEKFAPYFCEINYEN